ncbi:MAG TPA: hypothetical protein VKS99_14600 [Blastocatellia bacterium]|nr:hypothetical protein [Blastocatellia bacterium]
MRLNSVCLTFALLALFSSLSAGATDVKVKEEAVGAVEKRRAEMIKLSDQIWAFAETALREHKSSEALSRYAEQQGFEVERGVAGMPTAFIASYGQGRPVIGILGEFDALPGISQKASPVKEPLEAGAPGHSCGHNLFGVASLGAAIAVKELMAAGKLKGTIQQRLIQPTAEGAKGRRGKTCPDRSLRPFAPSAVELSVPILSWSFSGPGKPEKAARMSGTSGSARNN